MRLACFGSFKKGFKIMEEKIWKVLKRVMDPELGINLVDLGLIYQVKENDGKAEIIMTLTSPACPLSYIFEEEISKRVKKIKGIKKVNIKLTFDPIWTPDKMSPKAKMELKYQA